MELRSFLFALAVITSTAGIRIEFPAHLMKRDLQVLEEMWQDSSKWDRPAYLIWRDFIFHVIYEEGYVKVTGLKKVKCKGRVEEPIGLYFKNGQLLFLDGHDKKPLGDDVTLAYMYSDSTAPIRVHPGDIQLRYYALTSLPPQLTDLPPGENHGRGKLTNLIGESAGEIPEEENSILHYRREMDDFFFEGPSCFINIQYKHPENEGEQCYWVVKDTFVEKSYFSYIPSKDSPEDPSLPVSGTFKTSSGQTLDPVDWFSFRGFRLGDGA